jgi:hypothetical protein
MNRSTRLVEAERLRPRFLGRAGRNAAREVGSQTVMAPLSPASSDVTNRLSIIVRPGRKPSALGAAVRCLRRLVPDAGIFVSPALPRCTPVGEVVVLDADEVAAGPLSAATALTRERGAAR